MVLLDCCFSGGFGGARVLAPSATRALIEDRSTLESMVHGTGRIVLTASGAAEPALETAAFGHGLLSYHFIDGLQGAESLATGGLIDLMTMLRWVVTKVVDSAERMGAVQTPTIYGSLEGAPAIEVLAPGTAYAAAFPSRARPPATADWQSLTSYGLPDQFVGAWTAAMPGGLNELQQSAVNDFGVLDGKSALVVAPTGSGKTMIGEIAALQQAALGHRAVMLLPLRALVNDKYEYFQRVYGNELKVIRASGEFSDQSADLYAGQYDVALLTYEKFLNIAVATPHILRSVSTVVVDEVQNISDPNRGASLEFLLTLLRSGHGRGAPVQLIALSAVVGATNEFELWIGGGLLRTNHRPVPLRESVIDGNGHASHRLPNESDTSEQYVRAAYVSGGGGSKQIIIPLVQRLVNEGKKVIVFRSIKGETMGTAGYLADHLGLPPAESALTQLPAGDLSSSSRALNASLQGGVGFHNADLDRFERAALESAFRDRDSDLRVLVSTTTLAMGINTPAEAVVIAGLRHPYAGNYSVAEYKNMAGRAGRPGFATAGESYIVATGQPTPGEAWRRYIEGTPEPITTHFLDDTTDPQNLVVRALTVLGGSVAESELIDLLENSFAVWLAKRLGRSSGWDVAGMAADLDSLVRADLLDREPSGELTLTALGRFAGESGLEVRSVARVSSALRFVGEPLLAEDLVLLAQVTVELDELYMPRNKRSHQESARWPRLLAMMGCSSLAANLHIGGGDSTDRAKKAVAALRYISAVPLGTIEAELGQHMRPTGFAGPIRSTALRTRDVIAAVAQIALLQGRSLASEDLVDHLLVALETGAPLELASIAQLLGVTATRAQYLQLDESGVRIETDLAGLQDGALATILGAAIAQDLLGRLEVAVTDDEGTA
ncbi:caspase family protein [soil metagenome]